jgi:hypothetical protein
MPRYLITAVGESSSRRQSGSGRGSAIGFGVASGFGLTTLALVVYFTFASLTGLVVEFGAGFAAGL